MSSQLYLFRYSMYIFNVGSDWKSMVYNISFFCYQAREAVEMRAQVEKKMAQKEKEKKEEKLRELAKMARDKRAGIKSHGEKCMTWSISLIHFYFSHAIFIMLAYLCIWHSFMPVVLLELILTELLLMNIVVPSHATTAHKWLLKKITQHKHLTDFP